MKFSKMLFIASAGICCASVGVLWASETISLTTDLTQARQHIGNVIFSSRNTATNDWNPGRVKVSAEDGKLKIE